MQSYNPFCGLHLICAAPLPLIDQMNGDHCKHRDMKYCRVRLGEKNVMIELGSISFASLSHHTTFHETRCKTKEKRS